MDIELTEQEKEMLTMMIKMVSVFFENDKYIELHGEVFSSNELFDLAQKLGIDYY